MSLQLILMRHAKSDWDTPAGGDFERTLNKRGRRSATAIGKWLATNGYNPETVLCSAATRTQETWHLVSAELGGEPTVNVQHALYLASPDQMFQEICQLSTENPVLMIAHNPGSAILANALADGAPAHSRFDDYPTAATAVFEFPMNDWGSIRPGTGHVVDFVVPRDLV